MMAGSIPGRFDDWVLDVFQRRPIEKDRIVRAGLPSVFVNELVSLLLQDGGNFLGHRNGLAQGAAFVFFPIEALAPATLFAFFAATAGARSIKGELLAWHEDPQNQPRQGKSVVAQQRIRRWRRSTIPNLLAAGEMPWGLDPTVS
jgi:hypothetical protein